MSDSASSDLPVLVVLRHEKGVLSWQLPMVVQVWCGVVVLRHYKLPMVVQVEVSLVYTKIWCRL